MENSREQSTRTCPGDRIPKNKQQAHLRRVLFFVTNPQRLSGSNRSLLEFIKRLGPGYEPVLCTTGIGEMNTACERLGFTVHVLKTAAVFRSEGKPLRERSLLALAALLFQYPILGWKLFRLLRVIAPSIVHTNDPKSTLIIGLLARLLSIPVVSHLRGEPPCGGVVAKIYESIPKQIIPVSYGTQKELSGRAIRKSTVLYNGTDDVAVEGSSVQWLQHLRESGQIVFLIVASVVPFKGMHHLLRAISMLPPAVVRQSTFVVVGDILSAHRHYYEALLQTAREEQITSITFAGWQDTATDFYRSADALLLTSVSREVCSLGGREFKVQGTEGLPRTILEAMCFELPVIASRVGGVAEQVVHGETGFVYEPGNAAELARGIELFVTNRSFAEQLGQAGRERVLRKFSFSNHTKQIRAIYDKLL